MSTRTYSTSGHIDNTPEAVIAYVADPRKRPLFFPSLKSVSDIKGEPTAVGTTWKWTFSALGFDSMVLSAFWVFHLGIMMFWMNDTSRKKEDTFILLDKSLRFILNAMRGRSPKPKGRAP